MKTFLKFRKGILFSIFCILFLNVIAQNSYIVVNAQSSMKILGTSSLHNWHMEVGAMTCKVDATLNAKHNLDVSLVDFSCSTTALKSESSMMDAKAYDALKAEKVKNITFNSVSKTEFAVNGGTISGEISGDLQIAGINKKMNLPFNGEIENGEVKLVGEIKVKMTDFKIVPPTAIMGTIKTGDEITIQYNLLFIQ